ncbi:MAG: hypothetical protein S0880_37310 [Actinomycetota bacterium]|nr:hypothetical protein [Actinomycetota bacterium]
MRTLRTVLAAVLLTAALALVPAGPVGAAPRQDAPAPADDGTGSGEGVGEPADTDFPTGDVDETPGIIPAPNSGVEPADAGKRGGAYQTVLFVAVCTAIAAIYALAVRDSRRSKRRGDRADTGSEHQPA